ncbi:MAG TPA: DnaJ family domain-containing protein [Candidatus Limnocylindria bacterium]|nr:DnaJ family domain-containing protein [Candidatus Limnocylindria bacterium]
MDDPRPPKLRRVEPGIEELLRELAESEELRGLPGEGAPLGADEGGPAETWAARHVMRNADAVPEWVDLRKDIDRRVAHIKRRLSAHRVWLHDRTRLLAELPAERIVEASRATARRDLRVRDELERAVSDVNALIRRYDLLVIPTLQLPLVALDRLGE